jgi:hypothetical protein
MPSRNAAASGYAILQRGQGEQATWLCLKYGPHGGGHGHPDKNNFILYARGQVICPDPGTRPYGSPLHAEWDKITVAHNTLVVDGASQAPATGKCLTFGSDRGVDYAMTDAGGIYPGVRFIRTAAMLNENLIIFVDRVEADKQHTFDLACHINGHWQQVPPGEKLSLSGKDGYQHFRDVTTRRSDHGLTLPLDLKSGWRGALTLAGNEPTEVITATGVGKSTEDRVPVAVFRRVAKQSDYVWAVNLDGSPLELQVTNKTVRDGGIVRLLVGTAQGKWRLDVDPAKPLVRVTGPE